MTYPAYEQYKDSGIPWLGQVPERWNLKRLKFSTHLINEKRDYAEIDLPYMGLEHIQSWTGKRIADDTSTSEGIVCRFTRNDVLFGKLRPYLAKVYLALEDGCASTEALVMRPKSETDPSYLKYFLLMPEFINAVDASTYGAKMPRANWEFIGNQLITLPKIEEQKAIAAFLDRKTAEIDALIGKKEALLALLEEKRTATITQAVTKGLNPAAALKPSDIPWLGDIPEHWDNASLRHISRRYAGGTPSKEITEYWTDGTIPWLNSGTVNQFIITEPSAYITEEAYSNSSAKWVPKGALLMALAGQGKTKGMVAETTFDTTCNQSMAAIVWDKNQHVRFMLYYLNAQYSKIRGLASVDARDGLNLEMIGGIPCPVPPISEQKEIAAYLDTKTAEIDAAKDKITAAIERLREYRTALITHAVTGKIKVV